MSEAYKVGDTITGRIRGAAHFTEGECVTGKVEEVQRKNGSRIYLLDNGRWLYEWQVD